MHGAALIFHYFPGLTEKQKEQFAALHDLYASWNEKINLISRKDIEHLYEKHILHSLAIARIITFNEDARVMDAGTGGGFPGVPLAILFPGTQFMLVDSIGKKIKVVNEIASAINLQNIAALHTRAEEVDDRFDFIVSRATASVDDLMKWTKGKYKTQNKHVLPNGLICFKGGDLEDELKDYKNTFKVFELKEYFKEPFFETKKIVYVKGGT